MPVYMIHLPTVHVYLLGLTVPEKSVMKNFHLEGYGMTEGQGKTFSKRGYNKGTNKQQQPDSGIHNKSTHCPRMYKVSTF